MNAAQAIPEHGTISISTVTQAEAAWAAITDTGGGIAPEYLKQIFDPFFTTKPVGKGTGLGLSVSHNVVMKHGGRFEVDSVIGKGTTFRVWLPIRQKSEERSQKTTERQT